VVSDEIDGMGESESNLIYKQNFQIRTSEIGEDLKLSIPSAIQLMQEASMQQIIDINASYWDLKEEGISWVLLKKEVHFHSFPKLLQKVKVSTYASEFDRFFAYRDYLIDHVDGVCAASASSQWALIDIESRKMVKMPERFQQMQTPNKTLEKPKFKLSNLSSPIRQENHKIKYYDLDWNGHLNNSVLIKKMLGAASIESFKLKPTKFQISFKSEAFLDQEIEVKIEEMESDLLFQVDNLSTEKVIALGRLFH